MNKINFLGLLDKCTTKHEVQTLLQTKMDPVLMDANFNIAILDGHKVWVAVSVRTYFSDPLNHSKSPKGFRGTREVPANAA